MTLPVTVNHKVNIFNYGKYYGRQSWLNISISHNLCVV